MASYLSFLQVWFFATRFVGLSAVDWWGTAPRRYLFAFGLLKPRQILLDTVASYLSFLQVWFLPLALGSHQPRRPAALKLRITKSATTSSHSHNLLSKCNSSISEFYFIIHNIFTNVNTFFEFFSLFSKK